ncbi:hypothetical protein ACFSX9_08240 [Flavobacterium ardleyense]|uniref:Uncharacterized protein n=1 Tax=Flavobacterium ardleyense TaxID=2038737 RepID=A0ABW5Z8D0_9FLAO
MKIRKTLIENMISIDKEAISDAKKTALISFLIGTAIFLAFVFFNFEFIAYIGIIFVLLATLVNGIKLLLLIYRLIKANKNDRIEITKTILLILANIPIALVYLKIAGSLFKDRFGF